MRGCLPFPAGLPGSCRPTVAEVARPLPGDELVPDPVFTATHARSIDTPPERVWPWLAQMGAGRGGWYALDRFDNGGVPSVDRLVPDLQDLTPGDVLPALPGATDAFVVAVADPPDLLVLTVPDGDGHRASWTFAVLPEGDGTRLVVRARLAELRVDLPNGGRIRLPRLAARLLARPVHGLVQRRQLTGIDRRATTG